MIILYSIVFIIFILTVYIWVKYKALKHIQKMHMGAAHTTKYSNNGKFNEAYNITLNPSDEKKYHLRPIINLDNPKIKIIAFMNNVNYIALSSDQKVGFDLNLKSDDDLSFYFVSNNYKIDKNQTLATNLIFNNFPKLYENDKHFYNILNLKDLGHVWDIKLKADDIVSLVFNGKKRELIILTNDNEQTEYYIRYKSKKDMVRIIKETSLYRHIMQWGVPGFTDSVLSYINNKTEGGK